MPDNPSKLQNIQLPTQPSDGLAPGVVEADGLTGGEIDSSPITGAAEKSVERRPCDCEYSAVDGGFFVLCLFARGLKSYKYCCRVTR